MSDTAFYITADSRHFLGLVALVNSLRLLGHDEPIYVGDCGLDGSQRHRLAEHVTIIPTNGARAPHLAKMVAPLTHPADVMVSMDADIIVTNSLASLIEDARPGRVVAFADRVTDRVDRFGEEWSELLGIGPLTRRPYINSGIVIAERELASDLYRRLAVGCDHVEVERSVIANGAADYPFYYLDQDVLNALLGTLPSEVLDVHDYPLSPFPPFTGLKVVDESSLTCAYEDGVEPFALHHIASKPWMASTRWSVYSRLLSRLLLGSDVAVPLRRDELPLRLRTGRVAWLEKRRSDATAALFLLRGRLGLRRKLAVRPRRS